LGGNYADSPKNLVGAGSPTISGKNPQSRKPAPTPCKNPKTQYFDGISILMAGMGRVYEIVDLYQILLVNPPLQVMAIYHIFSETTRMLPKFSSSF